MYLYFIRIKMIQCDIIMYVLLLGDDDLKKLIAFTDYPDSLCVLLSSKTWLTIYEK